MVGVIAAYEARQCLWTVSRAIPAAMLMLLALMVPSHISQTFVGLGPSLVIGWCAFLCVLFPVAKMSLFRNDQPVLEPVYKQESLP